VGFWKCRRCTKGLDDGCKGSQTTCQNPSVQQRKALTYRGYPKGDGSCVPMELGQQRLVACCPEMRQEVVLRHAACVMPQWDRFQWKPMIPKLCPPVSTRMVGTAKCRKVVSPPKPTAGGKGCTAFWVAVQHERCLFSLDWIVAVTAVAGMMDE
jgi:hypothetical protein